MSGICGYIQDKGAASPQFDIVPDMVKRMKPFSEDSQLNVSFPGGGFGAYKRASTHSGAEMLNTERGKLVIAWDAEFLNLPGHIAGEDGPATDGKGCGIASYLAALYGNYGEDMFSKIHGDFSIAIWDESIRSLTMASDRFRVKSIYYASVPGKFLFASKLRSLFADPTFGRSINLGVIADYIDISVISTPDTIYRNAWKLPPGFLLVWKEGHLSIRSYWDLQYIENRKQSRKYYSRIVRETLERSALSRLSLEKDGSEIGAFLSGGVDSTAIVALLAKNRGRQVKAFSIGFKEERFNEIEYAKTAAQHYGVEHHTYFVSPSDAYDFIPKLAWAFDEPYGNSSAIPAFYCARMARERGMSCIFAGDGGDELFAGNERYARDKLLRYYLLFPSGLHSHVIKPLVDLLSLCRIPPFDLAKKYIRRATIRSPDRFFSYDASRTIPVREEMLEGLVKEIALSVPDHRAYREWYSAAQATNDLNRHMYIDMKGAISDNDLMKVTRMSEMAGLKVQFPFLSHELADISGRIPAEMKMRGLRLRSFFKKSFSDLLPRKTLKKKKHGFGLPIPLWLRTDARLRSMAEDLILSQRSLQRGYFQKKILAMIVERQKTDTTSFYGTLMWNLMMLELWHRTHHDG